MHFLLRHMDFVITCRAYHNLAIHLIISQRCRCLITLNHNFFNNTLVMSYSLRFLLTIGLDMEFVFIKDIIKTFHQFIKRRYEHFYLLKAFRYNWGISVVFPSMIHIGIYILWQFYVKNLKNCIDLSPVPSCFKKSSVH